VVCQNNQTLVRPAQLPFIIQTNAPPAINKADFTLNYLVDGARLKRPTSGVNTIDNTGNGNSI
jgi:hypothetical protein